MSIIIDIIALVIVAVAAFTAYRQGFVKTFFGLITVILAIILATTFHKTLAAYIKDTTDFDEWISGVVLESTANIGQEVNGNVTTQVTINTSVIDEIAGEKNIFTTLPDVISEKLGIDGAKEEIGASVTNSVTDVAINVLSWIVLYVVIQIILNIIVAILDGIMSLPVLKEINNIAGLAIGILLGFFRVYMVLAIIYFISNIVNISFVINAIGSSTMVSSMYNNNLLLKLIF